MTYFSSYGETVMTPVKPETVRLSSKGQLVIPRAIREALHWQPGTELMILPFGHGVKIQAKLKKHGKRLEDLRGCIKYTGAPISDETLQAPVDDYND
jgi:AbrB family looped-hinge helix DNA binding protein